MRRSISIWVALFLTVLNIFGQADFQTVAEMSDFKSTSKYNDVWVFIERLKKTSPNIRIEKIATTSEGREVPLLIIANPMPKSPGDLVDDKRIVVYIQADIHAGEVEGKEATLMYVRDLIRENKPEVLKNVVLLICPLFNPDGNEKISTLNRTYQNGPVNGVGVRYNGQYLDLNRDAMKVESPEVRGVLKYVFNKWDPAVFMDCHTTNGSFHVEPTTFTWMVNPNGDNTLIAYMREKMIPEISKTLYSKYKIENCFYGEFYDMMDPDKGWVLDASEPRYMTNYYGIRNRLGILNENYVYADFKSRVLGCYYLIHSLLDYVTVNRSDIKEMLSDIDKKTIARGAHPSATDSFAIEYRVRPMPGKVTIRTFEAELINDINGRRNYRKTERQKDVNVPYYIDYYPTRNVRFPFAYLITTHDTEITDILERHGIQLERLSADSRIVVRRFEISEIKGASRLNQGHYTNTLKGRSVTDTLDFPAGTIVVRTAQPHANVAAYLLEPESNDGLVLWNFFDRYLVPQWGPGYNPYPVYKILDRIDLKTEELL